MKLFKNMAATRLVQILVASQVLVDMLQALSIFFTALEFTLLLENQENTEMAIKKADLTAAAALLRTVRMLVEAAAEQQTFE